MATLQIRLRKGSPFWDVAQDVVLRIETVFSKHPEIVPLRASQLYILVHVVLRHLREAIEAYEPCETRRRCHALTAPACAGAPLKQPLPKEGQRILLLKEGKDALCTRLAADVFDYLCPNAGTSQRFSLIPEIGQAFQEALDPLLYDNPFCENCPRCIHASRTDPWTLRSSILTS